MSNYETNPVGVLQERFQSRGIVPQYNVVQAEGASHDPTFVFQVILGGLTATGTGSSKKQAKYAAARAMLDKLDGQVLTRDSQAPQSPVTDAASKPEAPGNTVRALKELYVKKDAVNDNYLQVPKVDQNSVTKNQTTNSIKIDFLRSGQTESTNNRCFADEKDIDLKECDQRCLKHPQELIRRNGIKVNLITLEKSKEITEPDNNATNGDLQSSQPVDSQIMKALSNEQVKSINNNIAENLDDEEPGAWMKNIKSPQKVCLSPDKLGSYLKNDHQNELSRDLGMRFPENERGRSQERRSSRESQFKNQQHRKIFESDIDDLLNNCRKDVDFGRRSKDSKNNSRKSVKSRKRSRSRRSRSRSRSTQRHGRERERDQSNYGKRNASLTFIGKGKENENEKHFMNITKKNIKNSDVFNEGEMVD